MPANQPQGLRERLHEIVFEADTPAGRTFDVVLLILILASVLAVIMETVPELSANYDKFFFRLEVFFTLVFSIEYIGRLFLVKRPWRYATSFYGLVDLLSVLPTYLALVFSGYQYFLVIRGLRLLRVFRIFKLRRFVQESDMIVNALKASRVKITVFLTFIVVAVIIVGALMYLVEGGQNERFSDIPHSIYWAIVTLTTVGYGDITPETSLGKFISAVVMIMGYGVIAVPTGIVTAGIFEEQRLRNKVPNTQCCPSCGREGHDLDARHCKYCGDPL